MLMALTSHLVVIDLRQGRISTADIRAMRLLRRTAAVFFDLLGASLLARLSPLSSKVAKTRKWIKACLLRPLSGRREGGDRLAAAPTPSQTFQHLRRPSPSATHHCRFAHVRPSGPPPTSKWLVTVSVFRSTTAT